MAAAATPADSSRGADEDAPAGDGQGDDDEDEAREEKGEEEPEDDDDDEDDEDDDEDDEDDEDDVDDDVDSLTVSLDSNAATVGTQDIDLHLRGDDVERAGRSPQLTRGRFQELFESRCATPWRAMVPYARTSLSDTRNVGWLSTKSAAWWLSKRCVSVVADGVIRR
jgi:hypothetical protein